MKRFLIIMAVVSMVFAGFSVATAEMGTSSGEVNAAGSVSKTVGPWVTISNVEHVANGTALRNRTTGWIALRGVPLGSTVVKALLYWNFSDMSAIGPISSAAFFNGNRVIGTKTADSADPCWGMTGNHTYRALVTAFVPATRPNEDYEVVVTNSSSTTGQNPWSPAETQTSRTEGATLLVIYGGPTTVGNTVRVYDALSGSMFFPSGTFTLTHGATLSGSGLFTMSGADGQRGSGHDNLISNEITTFNGAQIAGPPVAASDWDGSDGFPLPQLYDVHTHKVTLSGTASTVVYTDPGPAPYDCLVPVHFVIQGGL